MTTSESFERPLPGGLVMRSLRNPADAERLAAFNAVIHGPSVGPLAYAIMTAHPHTRPEYWIYVEEAATRRIVSSLCLIPWTWRYDDTILRSGEMGFVGTLEEYRGQGLIRAMNERFTELLQQGGFDLSHIQGIPYFYRQFGYEYAMPLEAWCRVELHQFGPPAAGADYVLRRATGADLSELMRLYAEAARGLNISTVRDELTWRYLLGPSLHTDTQGEPWMVVGPDGAAEGYVRVMPVGFGDGIICGEASVLSAGAAAAALRHVVALAREQGRPYVRLNLPRDHSMVALALARGAHPYTSYAWQLRLLDPPALLRKLAPAFERRIAASAYAGLHREVLLNLYRYTLALQFASGRLEQVEQRPGGGWGDIRLPPHLLASLLFGWRTLDELNYIFPDASVNDDTRVLAEALFPSLKAFLYNIY